ncbi:AEC family transporter [Aliarcobacter cibarius]|uniref:AEC family transporter n=1 Tax=Aliarcobacter cibarius TaxID=255507 RepID=A0A7L5JPQ5_9BACT|nr:AEC family transporter [Aliarcobacter cibarius]QKJ27187.1 putative permease [Aliarcobacter cibarius]TLT01591.1 AEC family transporter [Aliarcobacter cibarius]TLT02082.1 AEC family transporter [Aliarcobacter cibarius]TLT04076.1 AEC family transporter [Aliarcobacter cibarius]
MEQIFSSLIPIFSLIVMGYLFKKISFPSNDFWPMADKLTYYILMPALLIFTLSKAKLDSNSVDLVLVSIFAIFLTMFFLIIFNKISPTLNNSFTSVVQGGIRFNTYVFLALSSSLFGEKGLIFSAIIITFAIPILNIFCITIFAIYSENSKISFSYILKSIFKNPLIISCIIGAMINISTIQIPVSIENLLKILSGAALPLGLISIGYNLVIKEINSGKKDIILSSFAKFLLLPFFIYFIGKMFELEEVMISILVLFAIMPTAPTSFILARQLNGNLSLMTSIITVQTILAVPILIFYIKYLI